MKTSLREAAKKSGPATKRCWGGVEGRAAKKKELILKLEKKSPKKCSHYARGRGGGIALVAGKLPLRKEHFFGFPKH